LDCAQTSSAKPLLEEYKNIILLKAFTKIFAMPGVRLGYCLTCNQQTIEKLNCCGQPWSVSVFAQAAGIAAADEVDFIRESREYVQKERESLKSELSSCGLKVFDSMANFILFRAEGIYDLKEKMLQKGYLIRNCANFDGLDGSFYRIAVRTREENQGLIKALEDLL
jgi:threonine-phosphate decarboxylase